MTKTSFPTPKNNYFYLPDGWDTGWKAAKASIASAPAGVLWIGDSTTQGLNASNTMTTSYPAVMRTSLAAAYGTYGDYYPPNNATDIDTHFPWVKVGNITAYVPLVYNASYNNAANVAFSTTGDWSYTSPYACTAIDLIMKDPATSVGTWQYNIDNAGGTGLVTINTPGFCNITGGAPYRVAVSGLSNAIHTVRLGNGQVGGYLAPLGAICYNPGATGGLLFEFCGANSLAGCAFGITGQWWQGKYFTSSGVTTPTGFGWPTGVSLAMIQFGINDMQFGYAPDNFMLCLRGIITGLRRAKKDCSIILVIPNVPDANSDQTNIFANPFNHPQYVSRLYSLAYNYNCAIYNNHAKWGSTPVAQGFMTTANVHPNDAGYADMANGLLGVL